MTSSQTLLVNLLGPLAQRPSWLLATLASALGRHDLLGIVDWQVEFAPRARARFLGDMTRVDAYFVIETSDGIEAVVLELKYTDRFSSRRLDLHGNQSYHQLAATSNLWRDAELAFRDETISQLLRCHALGTRTLEVEFGCTATTLLLVSHPTDPAATEAVVKYQQHLRDPRSAVHIGLDQLLLSARESADCDESKVINELETRYLRHDLSEAHWLGHLEAQSTKKRAKPLPAGTVLETS